MSTTLGELRHTVRVLWRTPAFALAVIAVLALGIGASTAIFSIVNAVLLRPLPYDDSARIVRLFHVPPQDAFPGIPRFSVSPANFYDWKRDARAFDGMAIYRTRAFTLLDRGQGETVTAGAVGDGFFGIVRTPPAMGRVFSADEDAAGHEHVVVLSDRFWKSKLAGASDVLGHRLTLDGESYTVIGVMPPAFSIQAWGAAAADIWVPLAYTTAERAVRDNHNASVVARLNPTVTLEQANAEMRAVSVRLERDYPQANAGWSATVITLQELIVGNVRPTLLTLLAAVVLVLLIACANVGNLQITRAIARRKEFALRSAFGAGRGRIVRQVLAESLVLSMLGGVIGLLLARVALSASITLLQRQVPRADEIGLDWRVVIFAVSTSLVTAVLAGVIPAWRASHGSLTDTLKEGGRGEAGVGMRTRRVLIVCEVAMSLVLLMGASVMLRTLDALRRVDVGFDARNVLTMDVRLPGARYDTAAKKTAFFDTALERIRAVPGVQSAATIDDLPSQGGSVQPVVIDGKAELLPRDQPTTEVRKVTPTYLRTMGIPLLRGRDVTASDEHALLVSQSAATLLWGRDDPLGHHAMLPLQSRDATYEVVGIVGDVTQFDLTKGRSPTVYEYTRQREMSGLAIVIRTTVPPASVARAVVAAIHALDPEQPVQHVQPMTTVLDDTLVSQRLSATLLGAFAAVALTLAAVGIYSVLSYVVRSRRRDIGIRAALGAGTGDLLRSVVVEGMTPTVVGIAIGIAGALGAARLLTTMVWGVSASDPLTLVVVAGSLAAISLAACLLPAYRATQVDPVSVLRG